MTEAGTDFRYLWLLLRYFEVYVQVACVDREEMNGDEQRQEDFMFALYFSVRGAFARRHHAPTKISFLAV